MFRYILIFLGIVGIFLGFANPFIQIPFLVLLYPFSLYILAHSSNNYFRDTLLMGILGFGASFYWIAVTIHIYGAVPYVLAFFVPFVVGLYFALYGSLLAVFTRKILFASPVLKCVILGLLWYFIEYFRGFFLTGFSWFTLSSAFSVMPTMIQGASLIGAYALSGLFALVAFFFAEFYLVSYQVDFQGKRPISQFSQYSIKYGGMLILICVYWFGSVYLNQQNKNYGEYSIAAQEIMHKKVNVPYNVVHSNPSIVGEIKHSLIKSNKEFENTVLFTLVQGNISQNVKWSKLFQQDSINKFLRLTLETEDFLQKNALSTQENIFIYPETAFPITSYHHPDLYEQIRKTAKDKIMVYGIPYYVDKKYYNSIEMINHGQFMGRYSKEHLVPFGEYLPPLPLPQFFTDFLAQYGGVFSVGENNNKAIALNINDTQGNTQKNKQEIKIGSLVCYEAIFPEIARESVLQGANFFVNISNDAWYDKTSAPYQHLQLSLMRAVENGVYMLRASNTGVSAVIDKFGQILATTDLFTDETLSIVLPVENHKKTFYTNYASYILWGAMIICIGLLFAIYQQKKNLCE